MELLNALNKYDQEAKRNNVPYFEGVVADLLRLLSPFAPHFAEEMWEKLGYEYSIFNEQWPVWDEKALLKDMVEIAVQLNGKVKTRLEVPSNASEKEIEEIVMADDETKALLAGKQVVKVIVIKNRLVNIVVR
jgi:leucyl-tRNA synthetase